MEQDKTGDYVRLLLRHAAIIAKCKISPLPNWTLVTREAGIISYANRERIPVLDAQS